MKTKQARKHFLIKTDSIPWCVCLLGALMKGSGQYLITIESDNPVLQWASEYFNEPAKNMEEIKIPSTPGEYLALDVLTQKKTQIEIDLIMGMVVDQQIDVRETSIDTLASALLFRDHSIVEKPNFFFPRPRADANSACQILVNSDKIEDVDKYTELAGSFITAAQGFSNPVPIQVLDDNLSILHQLNAMSSPHNAFVTDANDPMLYVLRAWYDSYVSMNKSCAVLLFIPDDRSVLNPRTTLIWPQIIPSPENVTAEEMKGKGSMWNRMIEARFDPTAFHIQEVQRRQQVQQQEQGVGV